jgi:hypothetical protein
MRLTQIGTDTMHTSPTRSIYAKCHGPIFCITSLGTNKVTFNFRPNLPPYHIQQLLKLRQLGSIQNPRTQEISHKYESLALRAVFIKTKWCLDLSHTCSGSCSAKKISYLLFPHTTCPFPFIKQFFVTDK